MERKIGEIFEHNGEWYQCVGTDDYNCCKHCDFHNKEYDLCNDDSPQCLDYKRDDGKNVIFKKLEKVGEPTVIRGKPHQKFNNFVFCDSRICQYCAFHHKLCDVKCGHTNFI